MGFVRSTFRHVRKLRADGRRHREFRRAQGVLCTSGDLDETEQRLLRRISLEVNASDSMYVPGEALAYLTAGLSASRCISASLNAVGTTVPVGAMLDFPCGYGRVLRFLREMFPEVEIVAGEIDTAALDFCQRTFAVQTFLSQRDLRSLSLPRTFDLIWCGSLITHLDEPATVSLLGFFCRHLSDGGVCIFTAHGRRIAAMIEHKEKTFGLTEEGQAKLLGEWQQKGYGYADYAGRPGYGVSVASQARVVELARGVGAWKQTHYLENGWHAIQDVYALVRDTSG